MKLWVVSQEWILDFMVIDLYFFLLSSFLFSCLYFLLPAIAYDTLYDKYSLNIISIFLHHYLSLIIHFPTNNTLGMYLILTDIRKNKKKKYGTAK